MAWSGRVIPGNIRQYLVISVSSEISVMEDEALTWHGGH